MSCSYFSACSIIFCWEGGGGGEGEGEKGEGRKIDKLNGILKY